MKVDREERAGLLLVKGTVRCAQPALCNRASRQLSISGPASIVLPTPGGPSRTPAATRHAGRGRGASRICG
jgi:hypothetical protein